MIDDNNFIDVSEQIEAKEFKPFNMIEGSFRNLYHDDVKIGMVVSGEVKLTNNNYIMTNEAEGEDFRIRIYKRVF